MSTDLWILVAVAALLVAVTAVCAVTQLVKLVRLRAALRASGVARSGQAAFWLALAYLVSPVDLLPDPVLLDDIGILALALRHLAAQLDGARQDRQETPGRTPVEAAPLTGRSSSGWRRGGRARRAG